MMEGVKRKEERDRECLIRVGYSGGGAGGGGGGGCWPTQHSQWMWQPSVDLLTQTPPANESNLAPTSQRNSVSESRRSRRTKHTSINILASLLSQC